MKMKFDFNSIRAAGRITLGLGILVGGAESALGADAAPQKESAAMFKLVIHGGAGTLPNEKRTPERMAAYREALAAALRKGHAVLARGGPALDAVEAAITVLEESPLFNAGKGAVFTGEGTNELDASIMDGATRRAGAVAAVKTIKSPIHLARLILEDGKHVMLVGGGAEAFARERGVESVDPSYFRTDERWQELLDAKEKEKQRPSSSVAEPEEHYGTVGAVALDQSGNLAAGTSTGGMTNKRFGRVGDSPIIGAGTYADNRSCAVSATGQGEYFIRAAAAHELCSLVAYKKLSVSEAADAVIEAVGTLGGRGGVIAIDGRGAIAMSFNTPAMYRGSIAEDGVPLVLIEKAEPVER